MLGHDALKVVLDVRPAPYQFQHSFGGSSSPSGARVTLFLNARLGQVCRAILKAAHGLGAKVLTLCRAILKAAHGLGAKVLTLCRAILKTAHGLGAKVLTLCRAML